MSEKVAFSLEIVGTDKQVDALNKVEAELKNITKERNLLLKAQEKGTKLTQEESAKLNELTKKQITDRTEKTKLTKAVKDNTTATNAQKGSYSQISSQLSANFQKWRDMSQAERENTKAGRDLTKTIGEQRAALKKLDAGVGDSRRNVGGYSEAIEKAKGSLLVLGAAIGAVIGAFKKVSGFITESIEKFDVQQLAEVALSTALGKVSKELLNQASAYQQLTRFGDEEIIRGQAFLAQMGLTEKQILQITPSILDFAQAKGVDLKSAADLVAKSIGSETNALSRYGIQIEGAAGSQERLESGIQALDSKFKGQAEAALAGAGALKQLSNTWGDLMEKVGGFVANAINPAVKAINSFITVSNDSIGVLVKEKTEVNALAVQLTNTNTTEEERRKILEKLNQISPDIVKGLDAENISTETLRKNLELYNESLVNKIVLETLNNEAKEKASVLAETELKRTGFIISQNELLLKVDKDLALGKGSLEEKTKSAIDILKEQEIALRAELRASGDLDSQYNTTGKQRLEDLIFQQAQLRAGITNVSIETENANNLQSDSIELAGKQNEILKILGITATKTNASTSENDSFIKSKTDEISKLEEEKSTADLNETVRLQRLIDKKKEEIEVYKEWITMLVESNDAGKQSIQTELEDVEAAEKRKQEAYIKTRLAKFGGDEVDFKLKEEEERDDEATDAAEDPRVIYESLVADEITRIEQGQATGSVDISNSLFGEKKALSEKQLATKQKMADAALAIESMLASDEVKVAEFAFDAVMQIADKESAAFKAAAVGKTIINTATGIVSALATSGPPWVGIAMAAIVGAMGAANLAKIAGVQFEEGGLITGAAHKDGGVPFTIGGRGGFEAEGGEIMFSNKAADYWGRNKLLEMNMQGNRFASGGYVADSSQRGQELNDESINRLINGINNKQVINDPVLALQAQSQAIFIENNGNV